MWLLALAVPVQGYAAVTMLGCGPGHHETADVQSPVAVANDDDEAVPPHSHEATSESAGERHHGDSAEPDHAHALKAHGASGTAGKGSCTPCASCCVVGALPASMLVFQAIPLADFFVPLAPRGLVSFLTEGPERPPRSSLV